MRRAAVALLLFAAACSREVATAPPSQPARKAAAPVAEPARPQIALVDPLAMPGNARAARSVFAYQEAAIVQTHKHVTPQTVLDPTQPPSTSGTSVSSGGGTPAPTFPYRCIGRFGPDGAQLVAFVVDGEVKLAHAGDVLAERYLVRAIGIESVEVALLSAPETRWTLELGK